MINNYSVRSCVIFSYLFVYNITVFTKQNSIEKLEKRAGPVTQTYLAALYRWGNHKAGGT
jgi:cytosine/uracil/thiamine/allantoin permease